jgi:DNA-binding transcriptional regulator LsrR (DeoR family)
VIALAGGEAKAKAIHALLLSGIPKALVTDEITARAVLNLPS